MMCPKGETQPCQECQKPQRMSICDECWKPRDPYQHPDVVAALAVRLFGDGDAQ